MQTTTLSLSGLSAVLSLVLNIFFHHNLFVSLLNSFTLGLSIYFFQSYLNSKKSLFNIFFIISLGILPLFNYSPSKELVSFLLLLSLGFFYLYIRFPKKYLIVIYGLILFSGNIYASGIIRYPFSIQSSQLIFNSPEINFNINRHQQDALYIPYKVRLLVYSQLIYIYALLTNLLNFLNLKNLSDILLIANLYPLFTGFYKLLKQKGKFRDISIVTFLAIFLSAGIDRSADKFHSLYLLGPTFIYLILLGSQNINKKIYFILWILSFFIFISPKI